MIVRTEPIMSLDGAGLVKMTVGSIAADLTPEQAEDIAASLLRAATASRYESAHSELMRRNDLPDRTRALRGIIEERRISRS